MTQTDARLALFALAIATALGVGYVPIAPGTVGSAVGLLLWCAPAGVARWSRRAAIVVLFAAGCWSGSVAERHFGRTDPGQVVIDEVVGHADHALPDSGRLGGRARRVSAVPRRSTSIKPYPANRLERLPGGLGVMADDAMAAVYANLVLRALSCSACCGPAVDP